MCQAQDAEQLEQSRQVISIAQQGVKSPAPLALMYWRQKHWRHSIITICQNFNALIILAFSQGSKLCINWPFAMKQHEWGQAELDLLKTGAQLGKFGPAHAPIFELQHSL